MNPSSDRIAPTKADVVASLGYDIERVEVRRRSVGTSRWALYAAIAGLFWVLNGGIGSLQGKAVDFTFVTRCVSAYLGMLTGILFYALSYEIGAHATVNESSGPRIKFFDREFRSMRATIIAQMVLLGCGLAASTISLTGGFGPLACAAVAIQSVWFFVCAVIVAFSFFPLPFGAVPPRSRWQALLFMASASVVTLAGVVSLLEAWRAAPDNVSAHNGIALVLSGLVVVIALLIAASDDASSTADLVDLRRQLLLGWCSADEASRQIELRVLGHRSIEYLGEAVGAYVTAVNALREYLSARRSRIEEATASATSTNGSVSPDIAVGLLSVMMNDPQRMSLDANVAAAQSAMQSRAAVLRSVKSLPPEWSEVMQKCDADVQALQSEAASWNAMLERLVKQSGNTVAAPDSQAC